MPPFLPRKRFRSPTPESRPPRSEEKGKAGVLVTPRKPTLFDVLDAGTSSKPTAQKTKNLLAKLAGSDDESDLLSLSSSEPEPDDAPAPKRQRIPKAQAWDNDEDEDVEFEDVQTYSVPRSAAPPPSGDLELTLTKETRISLTNPRNRKQGPSKIERQIRISTHCMHVQFLLWHNWIRNGWINDKEVQQILVDQLGPMVQEKIQRWKLDSGVAPAEGALNSPDANKMTKKGKKVDIRGQRDWGEQAQRLRDGSDPLINLISALSKYWKKRFRVTVPGLKKVGYMTLAVLDEELRSFSKEPHDPERRGERIRDISEFRVCAKICEGSRDLGAQLFAALLRALGVEARMVVSLQPVGFGWGKNEEASEKSKKQYATNSKDHEGLDSGEVGGDDDGQHRLASATEKVVNPVVKKIPKTNVKKYARRSSRGNGLKEAPINLSDSDIIPSNGSTDEECVVDVTPTTSRRGPSKSYEKDLAPNYWVEVLSTISNTYYAVDPFSASNPITANPELLAAFVPRGAKSEKAKQVMAYVVGFSPDGTAKDVTVRYLKRHMWPGKTKGCRIPIEKVPVYNHGGKVKSYEEFDWFKTVMSRYTRSSNSRTEVDDHEEATDLRAIKPERKEIKDGEETLQSYKSSDKFVLERHLRREEALLPRAEHVKMFSVKGKKGEPVSEEKVYLRKDVVSCKSVETWHKEGREPKMGEQPLKRVPYRAATTNRKRELAEAEAASGEKILQGLYSWDQTDWIIPPPIVDGIIPKNGYGNMDVYVPSMVPVGAVHIPRRRTKEICKRLGIDYAEAVTGFEFGARMAVPIITGVVIAEENEEMVLEEWEKDEAERARKEDEKRIKAVLGMWRKFLMGMRILERVREEYGDDIDDNVDVLNPWTNKKSRGKNVVENEQEAQRRTVDPHDEIMAGGFLPEDYREEEPPQSFFPTRHDDDDEAGGFIIEGNVPAERQHKGETAYATPLSIPSNKHARRDATSEEEDISGRSVIVETKTKNQNKTPNFSHKGQLKSRASNSKYKRKPLSPSSDDEEVEEEAQEEAEAYSSLFSIASPSNKPPLERHNARPRRQPKRKAARKSETALKSHYFMNDSDEGEDDK